MFAAAAALAGSAVLAQSAGASPQVSAAGCSDPGPNGGGRSVAGYGASARTDLPATVRLRESSAAEVDLHLIFTFKPANPPPITLTRRGLDIFRVASGADPLPVAAGLLFLEKDGGKNCKLLSEIETPTGRKTPTSRYTQDRRALAVDSLNEITNLEAGLFCSQSASGSVQKHWHPRC